MFAKLKYIGPIAMFLWFAAGCFVHQEPKTDSESHFLFSCSQDCDDGLECICGVCTRFCEERDECVALQKEASCVDGADYPTSLWCSDLKNRAICDVECASDTDCKVIGTSASCINGFCRTSSSRVDSQQIDNNRSNDAEPNAQDEGVPEAVPRSEDGGVSMDAVVAQFDSKDSDAVSETDDGGASDDKNDAEQPPDETLRISRLYGNRYTFVVTREWNGSMDLLHLPWDEAWEELPEEDFDSVNNGPDFAFTLSDDGQQITMDDAETPEQTHSYTGTRTEQNDRESIYEISAIVGNVTGRVRVWTDGDESGAELMIYGSGLPIVLCQRGNLYDSCDTDDDCEDGFVCEPGPGCSTDKNTCVAGCRDNTGCGAGETCSQVLQCSTCPCPPFCVPSNANCEIDPDDPNSIDLEAFIEMANNAECADNRNLLYMINCSLIYWTWDGSCIDYGYGDFLFGRSPDEIYCRYTDSIGGPQESCENETYRPIFTMVVTNRDEANLGLSPTSDVQQIEF